MGKPKDQSIQRSANELTNRGVHFKAVMTEILRWNYFAQRKQYAVYWRNSHCNGAKQKKKKTAVTTRYGIGLISNNFFIGSAHTAIIPAAGPQNHKMPINYRITTVSLQCLLSSWLSTRSSAGWLSSSILISGTAVTGLFSKPSHEFVLRQPRPRRQIGRQQPCGPRSSQ